VKIPAVGKNATVFASLFFLKEIRQVVLNEQPFANAFGSCIRNDKMFFVGEHQFAFLRNNRLTLNQ
jgi:hypothetical protein